MQSDILKAMPSREVLYAKLEKLGVKVERLRQLNPTEEQLQGLLNGLSKLHDRKLIHFVTSLIRNVRR